MYTLAVVFAVIFLLAVLSISVFLASDDRKHVPNLIVIAIISVVSYGVCSLSYTNERETYCKTKQAVYLKDQDACFKLIAVK